MAAVAAVSDAEAATLLADHACEAAEKFVEVYYKRMDKERHLVGRLYMDTATLIWNGNAVSGQEAVQKFYEALPTSEHSIDAIDAQPVPSIAVGSQNSIIVRTSGLVRYQKNKSKLVDQTFILMAQQGNQSWKIISDCVRTTDGGNKD